MKKPDVQQKFRAMATDAVGGTSQEFAAAIERETKMWRGVADAANLKLE